MNRAIAKIDLKDCNLQHHASGAVCKGYEDMRMGGILKVQLVNFAENCEQKQM